MTGNKAAWIVGVGGMALLSLAALVVAIVSPTPERTYVSLSTQYIPHKNHRPMISDWCGKGENASTPFYLRAWKGRDLVAVDWICSDGVPHARFAMDRQGRQFVLLETQGNGESILAARLDVLRFDGKDFHSIMRFPLARPTPSGPRIAYQYAVQQTAQGSLRLMLQGDPGLGAKTFSVALAYPSRSGK